MFHFRDLNVRYEGAAVLHHIDLDIEAGEKVALIGPSGAGKTTLLRKMQQAAGQDGAYIHQQGALIPRLSVFHNVYAGQLDHHAFFKNLRNLIRPQHDEIEAVRALLEELGIGSKLFEKIERLSGGEQQRVAVARALYRGGKILLADEPVASIDPKRAEQVLDLIRRVGDTVVMSLHTVDLALEAFERIIALKNGRIFLDQAGSEVTPQDLKELFDPC